MDAAKASADLEKHDKLKDKYAQLKQSCAILKKGLLDKQDECGRLEQQLKEKETRLRQQLEEIDKLQYQNGRMSKQLGTLNSQVEDLKQKTQQSSWSVGGLISGKPQQEAIMKAEEEMRVLRDHMEMKIQENEDLHMKIFEEQRLHEEEIQRLRDAQATVAADLEKTSSDLDKERQQTLRLRGEAKQASEQICALEEQLARANASKQTLQGTLESERCETRRHMSKLAAKLARWVPFDEGEHEPWNLWNVAPRHGLELQRRALSIQQLQTTVAEACAQGSGMLQLWTKIFSSVGDDDSMPRMQVRTKLQDATQSLSVLLKESVPEMVSALGSMQLRSSVVLARDFRRSSAALLQAQRKWVLYQSLLLLHDWSSVGSATSRLGGVEVQGMVLCLWQLHRSTRALFSKLRLVACMPLLLSRSTSATHFRMARDTLRRGAVAAGPRMTASTSSHGQAFYTEDQLSDLPGRMLGRACTALRDASDGWESLGRCLSAWTTAQAGGREVFPQDGMDELLESLQRFCMCLADRVAPLLEQVAVDVPFALGIMAQRGCGVAETPPQAVLTAATAPLPLKGGRAASSCGVPGLNSYLTKAAAKLRQAPGSIGFTEAMQTLVVARRLSAEGSRAKEELRQQAKRLQVATEEKTTLADELRALQDKHELLRSNFQVLKDAGVRRGEEDPHRSALGNAVNPPVSSEWGLSPPERAVAGVYGDLVLSSRQRALLESLSVTAQESAALRQHGFFVDVISLSAGEAALASGPPEVEVSESWEMAVRKVYEQHCRSLQAQVRVADGRALDLQLSVQRCADLRREQEEIKQQLQDEVRAKHVQLDNVKEDITTTRKNYDSQLAMLTEHICTLSATLAEKDASLASMQAQKILCGNCGMWNSMGRLLSKDGGGTCKTCKEKVLSEGVV